MDIFTKASRFLIALRPKKTSVLYLSIGLVSLAAILGIHILHSQNISILAPTVAAKKAKSYPLHKNITATVFWVGESADEDNDYITNSESAWDDQWLDHFGGTDDPDSRDGFSPADFVPNENPFYFALPYNDLNDDGSRKKSAKKRVYWAKERKWGSLESMCKNRWVRIQKGGKITYAQWEDSGPYQHNDSKYVFGKKKPKNKENNHAGIDVSPAVRDYLGLSGMDKVSWKFVGASSVPEGPWKNIITASQISWE